MIMCSYIRPSLVINVKIGCKLPFRKRKHGGKKQFQRKVVLWQMERNVSVIQRGVRNIITVRKQNCRLVFVFFSHSHCNVCGLKVTEKEDFEERIDAAVADLELLLDAKKHKWRIRRKNVTIDNVCSWGRFRYPIFLNWNKYAATVQMKGNPIIRYDRERFHGIRVRFPGMGSLVLYTSGKYQIWGCKSLSNLKKIEHIFHISCRHMFAGLPYSQLTNFDNADTVAKWKRVNRNKRSGL